MQEKYLRALGKFDYGEIRIEKSENQSVRINSSKKDNGDEEVKTVCGQLIGTSVRVLKNGAWGFASGTHTNEIPRLIAQANRLAMVESGSASVWIEKSVSAKHILQTELPDTETVLADLTDEIKNMTSSHVFSKTAVLRQSKNKREIYTTCGDHIVEDSIYSYLSFTAIAKSSNKNNNIQRASERTSSRKGYEKLDISIGAKASEKAKKMLTASNPPKGRFTVVFDPELTGVFAHEAVGHASEGDSIAEKESILSDKVGKRIGNDLITIFDNPQANDFGQYIFDDEGIRGRKTILVEKGILKGYMHSRETASNLGMAPNGHARADGTDSVPIVRMSNTYIGGGESSHDDVFDIKRGIYLIGMKGGSVDIFTG